MRSTSRRRITLPARVLMAASCLVLAAISVNAYTIVMRDGRRVEIPNQFLLTSSTLTYEVGQGIQVTIQLSGIDIAATERANGEEIGSFLLKTKPAAVPPVSTARARPSANRSITNADLEDYRRVRIASEKAYEKRRRELGLPSAEQQRREVAAIEERTQEQLRNMLGQEEDKETYWRSRATSLREELAVNDAQIDYVRRRLDELPPAHSLGAFNTIFPFGTIDPFGLSTAAGPFTRFPGTTLTPVIRGTGVQINSTLFNPRPSRRFHDRRGFRRFPQANVFALPFDSYDYELERAELARQLDQLLLQRAAFNVRWRQLEEDARRAGAYPGWLRP